MTFFYIKLFSIRVFVFDGTKVKVVNKYIDSFSILPTNACREILRKYRLLFKPTESGILIIQERFGEELSSSQAIREIKDTIQFSFVMLLRDKHLLNNVKPYMEKNGGGVIPASLKPFFGRNRVLFFDNLDASKKIITDKFDSDCQQQLKMDANGKPLRDGSGNFQYEALKVVPLTVKGTASNNEVGEDDLASTVANKFAVSSDFSSFVVFAIDPKNTGEVPVNPPDDTSELPYYQLNSGAYELEKSVGSEQTKEVIYADNQLTNAQQLGIIDIYMNENTNSFDYEIKFETI